MKKILAQLVVLLAVVTTFAINYEVNSGQVTETCASDFPATIYLTNAKPGADLFVDLKDLHSDAGPAMMFKLKIYGDSANGEIFQSRTAGDVAFNINGSLVGDNTLIVVYDLYRSSFYPDGTPEADRWVPSQFGFTASQDIPAYPEVEAYTKDHHLGHPGIYVWSFNLKNIGSINVTNPVIRYYFTTEKNNTEITLFDYYTPISDIKLLQVPGTREYCLELDYAGTTLQPGQETKGAVENQVQLYYKGYANIDKANDFSNPIPEELFIYPQSTLFTINKKVAVYDGNGTLIEGEELPGYSKGDFVPVQ